MTRTRGYVRWLRRCIVQAVILVAALVTMIVWYWHKGPIALSIISAAVLPALGLERCHYVARRARTLFRSRN